MFNLFNKKKEVILKVEEPKKEPFDIIANPSPRRSEVIDLGDGRKVTVWDDFLIDLWFDELFKHITHAQIPWYLNNNVSRDDDGMHQFVHLYYTGNQWVSKDIMQVGTIVQTIHEFVDADPILVRIKANLRTIASTCCRISLIVQKLPSDLLIFSPSIFTKPLCNQW